MYIYITLLLFVYICLNAERKTNATMGSNYCSVEQVALVPLCQQCIRFIASFHMQHVDKNNVHHFIVTKHIYIHIQEYEGVEKRVIQ